MILSQVILVSDIDEELGTMDKMLVHQKGLKHRAFSVFIMNSSGEMLLQKRALEKYHSGGLWTNTCCSHPSPGEDTLTSAQHRLQVEMGFTTVLHPAFTFSYKADFMNGLIENEFDHVFIGYFDGMVVPDKSEVADFTFLSFAKIRDLLATEGDNFTVWFNIAFPKVEEYLTLKAINQKDG